MKSIQQWKSLVMLLLVVLAVQLWRPCNATPPAATVLSLQRPARLLQTARAPTGVGATVGTRPVPPPAKAGLSIATSMQERKPVSGNTQSQVNIKSPNMHQHVNDRLTRNGAIGQRIEPSMGSGRPSHSRLEQRTNGNVQQRMFPGLVGSVERLKSVSHQATGQRQNQQNISPFLHGQAQASPNLQSMHSLNAARPAQLNGGARILSTNRAAKFNSKSPINAEFQREQSGGRNAPRNQPSRRLTHQPNFASSRSPLNVHENAMQNIPVLPSSRSNSPSLSAMNNQNLKSAKPPAMGSQKTTPEMASKPFSSSFQMPTSHVKIEPETLPRSNPHRLMKKILEPITRDTKPLSNVPNFSKTPSVPSTPFHASSHGRVQLTNLQKPSLIKDKNIPSSIRSTESNTMKLNSEPVTVISEQLANSQGLGASLGQFSSPFPRVHNELPEIKLAQRPAASGVMGIQSTSGQPEIVSDFKRTHHPNPNPSLTSTQGNLNPRTLSSSNIGPRLTPNAPVTQSQAEPSQPFFHGLNAPSGQQVLPPRSLEKRLLPVGNFEALETNVPKNTGSSLTVSRPHESEAISDLRLPQHVSVTAQAFPQPSTLLLQEADSKQVAQESIVNSRKEISSHPPDSNEHPLNIAFANSAVPTYVSKAHKPVMQESAFLSNARVSVASIPNYFVMNPLTPSSSGNDGNASDAHNQNGNSTSSQSMLDDDTTIQDLHHDWKSEIFARYYSTIGVKAPADQGGTPKALNRNRKISNRTLTEAAALLIRKRNMTNLNESDVLNTKNGTDLAKTTSVTSSKQSSEIPEAYERFSRNINASAHAKIYEEESVNNMTKNNDDSPLILSSKATVSEAEAATLDNSERVDESTAVEKTENVSSMSDTQEQTDSTLGLDLRGNDKLNDNMKNASLESTLNEELLSEMEVMRTTEEHQESTSEIDDTLAMNTSPTVDTETDTASVRNDSEHPPSMPDSPVNTDINANLKNVSLESTSTVFPPLSNNSLHRDEGSSVLNLTPDIEISTEALPELAAAPIEEQVKVSNQETKNSLSSTFFESEASKNSESMDEEMEDSLIKAQNIIPTEIPVPDKTSGIIQKEKLDSSKKVKNEQLTEISVDKARESAPAEKSSSLSTFDDVAQTELSFARTGNVEASKKPDTESIPKAISSSPGNRIPQPRVKQPTRQVLINNTGIARKDLKIQPNERRVVVSLVDKQGRKILVPAVFTPNEPDISNNIKGLSALPVKEDASIYINTTPKPSVLNTADENKIKDPIAAKDKKPTESTTRRSLLDIILRRTTDPPKTTQRPTTIKTTTPKTTTLRTTTLPTKRVTNVIDLIWESVTRTDAPSTTTMAATTTTRSPPVTNLIDLIWASATEDPTPPPVITTTSAPAVTNLIDLIWASATEDPTPPPVVTTTNAPAVTNLIDLILASATEIPPPANEVEIPRKIETTTTHTPGVTNLIDLIWASVTEDSIAPAEKTERPQDGSTTDPLIPVLQDVISRIDKRLEELQREVANGNTTLAEELNLLATQMIKDSGVLSQVPVQTERQRSYLVASAEKDRETSPVRIADIVEDTPLDPILTLLREEVNKGAELVRKEVAFLAEDTADTLRRGVEDASQRVSRITATSYRGALQTRDALVGLLGSALENMSVYVNKVLQDSIQTAFGTARSVGDFIRGLNDNLVGGILRQGRAVRNLFSDTIKEMSQASDRTIEVVNRVVEKNIRTIMDDK